jgi:DNA repair protein RadC
MSGGEVRYKVRIKDIPKDERPRERLIKYKRSHWKNKTIWTN